MIKKLEKLLKYSYSPYSKVKVSAIVKTNNDNEYVGVNVENASYGATICAEKSALTSAISNGTEIGNISEIHIYSNVGKALYPCLLCLQFMSEFLNDDSTIYIYGDAKIITTNIRKLIPHKIIKSSFIKK